MLNLNFLLHYSQLTVYVESDCFPNLENDNKQVQSSLFCAKKCTKLDYFGNNQKMWPWKMI